MGQIWITGDTHGAEPFGPYSVDGVLRRFNTDNFPEQKQMTKEDLVIVLGDFGLVWNRFEESPEENHALTWLEKKPFSLCFLDGNHENFDRLYAYPEDTFMGGRVHVLRPSVRHLMRGEVFTFSARSFFTFGGAQSHDIRDGVLDVVKDAKKILQWKKDPEKLFRVKNITWWERELPSPEEMQVGRDNLARVNWRVDHVLTHALPPSIQKEMGLSTDAPNVLDDYLEEIKERLSYRYWWGGHYHMNCQVGRHIELYEQLVRLA